MKTKRRFKIGFYVLLVAVLMIGMVSIVSAKPNSPFKGPWEAIDIDGSFMRLTIAGGGRGVYRLVWRDTFWSLCDGGPGIGRGTGTIDSSDPNVLNTSMEFRCGGVPALSLAIDFTYDPSSDTITDDAIAPPDDPVTWGRTGGP